MADNQDLYSDSDEDENDDLDEEEVENENEEDEDEEGGIGENILGVDVDDCEDDVDETELVGGIVSDEDDDDEDDDDPNSSSLQKFNEELKKNYILDFHPECSINNYDEINALTKLVRDKNGNIIDDLHQTLPYLTKYERTRVLGQRAKQINSGAKTFVKVPENIIDGYLIAELELVQKRIPYIIRRPIPGGGCEYWNLKELEIVSF